MVATCDGGCQDEAFRHGAPGTPRHLDDVIEGDTVAENADPAAWDDRDDQEGSCGDGSQDSPGSDASSVLAAAAGTDGRGVDVDDESEQSISSMELEDKPRC